MKFDYVPSPSTDKNAFLLLLWSWLIPEEEKEEDVKYYGTL